MIFTYFRKTGELYRDTPFGKEWDGDTGYDFEYEPKEEDLREAVVNILFEAYLDKDPRISFNKEQQQAIKKVLRTIIDGFDQWEGFYEEFYDELKEYFEDEAMESENND